MLKVTAPQTMRKHTKQKSMHPTETTFYTNHFAIIAHFLTFCTKFPLLFSTIKKRTCYENALQNVALKILHLLCDKKSDIHSGFHSLSPVKVWSFSMETHSADSCHLAPVSARGPPRQKPGCKQTTKEVILGFHPSIKNKEFRVQRQYMYELVTLRGIPLYTWEDSPAH